MELLMTMAVAKGLGMVIGAVVLLPIGVAALVREFGLRGTVLAVCDLVRGK